MNANTRRGSILLEALIATAIAAIFFTAIAGLLLAANQASSSLYKSAQARWIAEEGLSVLREISFDTLTTTPSARLTYNPTTQRWSVANGTAVSLANGTTHTITVQDIYRDTNCAIVSSGGTLDPDSRLLTSTISWTTPTEHTRQYNAATLRTRWSDPQGSCFKPTQAGYLSLVTSTATWGGEKQLRDVTITNNTNNPSTVTTITVTWSYPTSKIQQMFIGSGKIWSDNGPGTPSGSQSSGTLINVQDFTIPAHSSGETYKIQFTKEMNGSTINITFGFADGSTLTTGPFIPQ